ncbi:MAG: hypothetical protein JO180_04845 [Gemmatirosa sp.]|nr:hypothetical protein [Gemmatirosa sp.]
MLRRPAWLVLIGSTSAVLGAASHAQMPEPTLAQLAHRTWTARDGAPGAVVTLAQTRDGFLWLGGNTGLVRFDGVRFERYEPPAGAALPSTVVNALEALPDGALWVGYALGGVSLIAHGRLVSYGPRDGLPEGAVTAFALDSAGTLWVATSRGLAYLSGSRWQVVGAERGYPVGYTDDLTVDRRGALWVVGRSGVYVLRRGAQRFTLQAPPLVAGEMEPGKGSVREGPQGDIWTLSPSRGIARLTDTTGRTVPAALVYDRDRGVKRAWAGMRIDREGHAWGVFTAGRLVRVALNPGGRSVGGRAAWDTLAFSTPAGTTGRMVVAVFEDREGTIWVATEGGLDQFRAPKFIASEWPHPEDQPRIAAADAGGVWAGDAYGRLALVGDSGRTREDPPSRVTAVRRDLDGEVWVGGVPGLWHGRDGQFAAVALPRELQQCVLAAIARARDGTLWVSGQRRGTFRRRGAAWERYGAPDTYAQTITADSAGHVWLGYQGGRLVREGEGASRIYGAGDGLRVGSVLTVAVHDRRVWVGGELGVAVLDDRAPDGNDGDGGARFSPLVTADGPFRSVSGIVVTADAAWLRDADGVARMPAAEVERALREPEYRARAERFDARDRVDGPASVVGPTAVLGTEGRLWVAWIGGLGWIDPAHVRRNRVPPPVLVRALAAGDRVYPAAGRVTLPERTRALSVAYTALSLAVPERVRFRYRLVGLDTAWQEAGARREAFYTNLAPGAYRFEVTAANDDGVWSVAPAALDIVIPSTFVQTRAFLALCALGASGLAWSLVQWRHRRAAAALRADFEARLAERTRIARELHDTLLQGFTGVTLQVHAARALVHARPDDASDALARAEANAHATLREARHMVGEMRAPTLDGADLADAVTAAARDAVASAPIALRVVVRGDRRRLPPDVEATVLRIAREAVTNAARHASPRAVDVTLAFDAARFTMSVRDDGRGFAAADLDAARRNGHWGIVGMRERATQFGGRLDIQSTLDAGTLVTVVLPVDGVR